MPPLAPGEQYAYDVRATFVVQTELADFDAAAFRVDLARLLDVAPSDVYDVTVSSGSVVVTADVRTFSVDARTRVEDSLRSAAVVEQLRDVSGTPTVEALGVLVLGAPPPPPRASPPWLVLGLSSLALASVALACACLRSGAP
jgi:hypothetical protein